MKIPARKSALFRFFVDHGLDDRAGTQAARADALGHHTTVGLLVAHVLQVGIKAALGLYVGMAHKVADLGLFSTYFALFRHGEPPMLINSACADKPASRRVRTYTPHAKKASLFLTKEEKDG
mgnify:CR=1 FL=1